jgi:hypothetical protein
MLSLMTDPVVPRLCGFVYFSIKDAQSLLRMAVRYATPDERTRLFEAVAHLSASIESMRPYLDPNDDLVVLADEEIPAD